MSKRLRPLSRLEWLLLRFMAKPYGSNPNPDDPSNYPNGKYRSTASGGVKKWHLYPEVNSVAAQGVKTLRARGLVGDPDEYGSHRITEAGKKAAAETPEPAWTPAIPALRPEDREVLVALRHASKSGTEWTTPQFCGGRDGSHHSASLHRLACNGLAELTRDAGNRIRKGADCIPRPSLGFRAKGSREFRITPEGLAALAKH